MKDTYNIQRVIGPEPNDTDRFGPLDNQHGRERVWPVFEQATEEEDTCRHRGGQWEDVLNTRIGLMVLP